MPWMPREPPATAEMVSGFTPKEKNTKQEMSMCAASGAMAIASFPTSIFGPGTMKVSIARRQTEELAMPLRREDRRCPRAKADRKTPDPAIAANPRGCGCHPATPGR
mmetsp:Transcript_91577/g.112168  ORF Transcript_91577/g.112168 Transcript_91577/m.112168 type:complete len:107 (-) Transcript_91577:145-465(-)